MYINNLNCKYLLAIILFMQVSNCYSQVLKNGYYRNTKISRDIVFLRNDTVIFQYFGSCWVYLFKGKIVNGKINALPFKYQIKSKVENLVKSESDITRLTCNIYSGVSKEKITGNVIECFVDYFDHNHKRIYHKNLDYNIENDTYNIIVPDTNYYSAEICIQAQGCKIGNARINAMKNESLSFDLYLYPAVIYSNVIAVNYSVNKDMLQLIYTKDILFPPNSKIHFYPKMKMVFERVDESTIKDVEGIKQQVSGEFK